MLENVAHPLPFTLYIKHYTLNTTHDLKQRFISVYRPMLGQSAGTALDVKAGKAVVQLAYENALSALLHQKLEA